MLQNRATKYNGKLFLCPPKIINSNFSKEFTLCNIRQNIYIWNRKLNLLPINSIHLVFSFREMQRRLMQTKSILQAFLLCLKRNVSQTFKCSSCKKIFPKFVCH